MSKEVITFDGCNELVSQFEAVVKQPVKEAPLFIIPESIWEQRAWYWPCWMRITNLCRCLPLCGCGPGWNGRGLHRCHPDRTGA